MVSTYDGPVVKILDGALEYRTPEIGEPFVNLRGIISPDSLCHLQYGDYQREVLSERELKKLVYVLQTDTVPDVDLGFRGKVSDIEDGEDGAMYLRAPVFCIDGRQRSTAGLMYLEDLRRTMSIANHEIRIGALIRVEATEDWERNRFRALNRDRKPVPAQVILRNEAYASPVAALLLNLASNPAFSLCDRITWEQKAKRSDLLTASTYFGVAAALHGHVVSASPKEAIALCRSLDRVMKLIGETEEAGAEAFTNNIIQFYEVVDECWNLRVTYREGRVHLTRTFLSALATCFSRHADFWRGNRLVVDSKTRDKLAGLEIDSPFFTSTAKSASTSAQMFLARHFADYINSGRRSHKLTERANLPAGPKVRQLEVSV